MRCFIWLLQLILVLCGSIPVYAWELLSEELDLTCLTISNTNLNCRYRTLPPALVSEVNAEATGSALQVISHSVFPSAGGNAVILFLVDTSDPARQNVIEKNIEHIGMLLRHGRSHHRFGLASFDKDLRIDAPPGASATEIITAAQQLSATGKTTELYRNVIKAIEVLRNIQAQRKALVLFSDGQAEDRAYFHEDVIKVARNAGVVINSLGYQRSVPLSVALQTIRRLSEETGGVYIESDNAFNLPAGFLDNPFSNIDTGGNISVDISPLMSPEFPEQIQVQLKLLSGARTLTAAVPVTNTRFSLNPATVPVTVAAQPAAIATVQPDAIRVITPVEEVQTIDTWLWYGIPVAFLILIILTAFILIVLYRQQKTSKGTGAPGSNVVKPYAYLVKQDETRVRYPITNTTWRIGRTRDNELTLNDKSVSRRHAEIQRYNNGNFVVFDVDSLNGVYVNSEQVKKRKLEEGDIIEIGDVLLRFTTQSADFTIEEDTAIQNTRQPVTH